MRQANVNGKGAIFQVSDTKWVAKICLGVDENGKPIIKQFSGKTEAIAKKKLRDFMVMKFIHLKSMITVWILW